MLGITAWQRAHGGVPIGTGAVYAACSFICHQKPERSFHWAAAPWPVCARCSGLYLAAPFGAVAALGSLNMKRRLSRRASLLWLAAACVPTAVTLGVEWAGLAAPSNLVRALSAVPAGAMIAFILIRTAASQPQPIE
jgi:uncharacterized membrane protein